MRNVYSKQYKTLLTRLKEAREASKLTQAQVATKLKKSQSFVSKTESGERRLDVIELNELAQLYKKPLAYFVD